MNDNTVVLEYSKHSSRLMSLQSAVEATIGALEAESLRMDQKLKGAGGFKSKLEEFHKRMMESGLSPEWGIDEIAQGLRQFYLPESTQQITINFGLVGLCTELEIFISHLVRVIFRQQPMLLKSLASQKNLSTNEILELQTYSNVVSRLHDKVVKEIIDSNAREMILRHLGERLGLFAEAEFVYDVAKTTKTAGLEKLFYGTPPDAWGLKEVESAFRQRHEIVHEGKLPLNDLTEFLRLCGGFIWIVTFLSAKAIDKYQLHVDDPASFLVSVTVYGVILNSKLPPPTQPAG
jgi:hypothetical protein